MIRFVFTVEDLARTRFAISPMWEAIRSLGALRDPSYAALHMPWLRGLSGRLGGLGLEPVVALIPPRGYAPDFLTPAPAGPLGRIDGRPGRAAADAGEADPPRHRAVPEPAPADEDPGRVAGASAAGDPAPRRHARGVLGARARARVAADPRLPRRRPPHRARRLAQGGPAALFADLHPGVTWADDHLDVASVRDATIALGGRGLVIMPSAFQWARPATTDIEPWQPTLIYPARGIATLWDEGEHAPDGLARLLGATRAAVLADLHAPRSTTDLAQRLSISPADASHHLTTLRDAGLITARREGRVVLYVRTPIGDTLVVPPGGTTRTSREETAALAFGRVLGFGEL